MFKFVLPFLLFFCAVQSSFARAHADRSKIDYQKSSNEDGQSINDLSNNCQKPIQNITKNVEFIVPYGPDDKFITNDVWTNGTRLHASICRFELIMMTDGFHLIFPINENVEVEKKLKVTAIAIFKLMMNLKTMERTYKVTENVTAIALKQEFMPMADIARVNERTIKQYLENDASAVKHVKTFLANWFQILDQQLDADTELNTHYQKLKAEAKEYVKIHPSMQKYPINFYLWEKSNVYPSEQEIEKFMKKPIVRIGVANKIFMNVACKNLSTFHTEIDRKGHLLARAFLEKASSNETAVNQVYHKALKQISLLEPEKIFDSIEKFLKDDSELDAEIQILMKTIEGDYKKYEKFMCNVDTFLF